jgi:hypothetical protein
LRTACRTCSAVTSRLTLIIGAGHSTANVLIDLVELARRNPRATVLWVTRCRAAGLSVLTEDDAKRAPRPVHPRLSPNAASSSTAMYSSPVRNVIEVYHVNSEPG